MSAGAGALGFEVKSKHYEVRSRILTHVKFILILYILVHLFMLCLLLRLTRSHRFFSKISVIPRLGFKRLSRNIFEASYILFKLGTVLRYCSVFRFFAVRKWRSSISAVN